MLVVPPDASVTVTVQLVGVLGVVIEGLQTTDVVVDRGVAVRVVWPELGEWTESPG